MWIFQYKFSSIFIARYLRYFICLKYFSQVLGYPLILLKWKAEYLYKKQILSKKIPKKIVQQGVIHMCECTKGQAGRGGVKPNAYICLQEGGGFKVGYVHMKIFWTKKSQNFSFFVQKKLLHCHLLLCIEKCKLALNYKQKSFRCWFSEI